MNIAHKEAAYRIGVEEATANKLTQEELKVVYSMTQASSQVNTWLTSNGSALGSNRG